ncbi:MAG: NAD(P)/FAD-dependent oxidoreductase [Candidatus Bathyarchaeia archaeon]
MHNTFDVGIVGAGVAGSSCAQVLGEAGVKVALFDHSHPREKPCGGLIEDRVIDEFDIPEELLENKIEWVLAERFKFRVRIPFEHSMFLVLRKNFDYYLLQRALNNKSVTFFAEKVTRVTKKGNNWILKTSKGGCIEVKALIGADGCPSLIRKYLLKPIHRQFLATTVGYNFYCPSSYIEKAFIKNTIETYYSREYVPEGGYIWIFPKKASINVGIGSIKNGQKLKRSLDKFMLLHPASKRLKILNGHFFAHLVPAIWKEDFFDIPCSGNNWALIGDAAGHVNPIGGAGIYYAMKGGMLCGSALLDGDLSHFEKHWRRDYGDELYYGARKALAFYSNFGFFLWLQYISKSLFNQLGRWIRQT